MQPVDFAYPSPDPRSAPGRLLLLRRGQRASGADGARRRGPQRRPVAPGDGRAERQGGRPAAGPDLQGVPAGSGTGPHAAGALQPALRG